MRLKSSKNTVLTLLITTLVSVAIPLLFISCSDDTVSEHNFKAKDSSWIAPLLDFDNITKGEERKRIIQGEDIITNTAKYFGPNGSVKTGFNGMNCQNCHLRGGTKPLGNNYGAVFTTYPKYRTRSNSIETLNKRVNDCFERSLNGTAIDTTSSEMLAIIAYINWLGKDVSPGSKPKGTGLGPIGYLERSADTILGKTVYETRCRSCHGNDGQGVSLADGTYQYPPLWGRNSYNDAAGLFRISKFAAFVKYNMPFVTTMTTTDTLTEAEAWDVAAYVNSRPRPAFTQINDWPDISRKSVDEPFGPYVDTFSQSQHKYGPFQPIRAFNFIQEKNRNKRPI